MLVDRNDMWYRVLVARCGDEDGVLKDGGGRLQVGGVSSHVCVIVVGGVGGEWFRDCVTKMLGNGRNTYFWTDP